MIIEKIKDKTIRERLLAVREGFPKDPVGVDPNVYCFPEDDMAYLPIDRIIEVNESISEPEESVMPSDVLSYFIKNASHRCIMNFCICRESMECRKYPVEYGCLFLGDAAAQIHPELGRQVNVEEALEYAQKCRDAGLIHLVGRDKLDVLWLDVEPEEKLLTVCNCCPCCCLHRVASHMTGEAAKKVKRMPGVSIRVTDNCVGCGTCVDEDVCIFNALEMGDEKVVINDPECRACGRCADICPEGAIEISIDDPTYVDKTIKRFMEIVDIK